MGGKIEDIWMPPRDGVILGAFRLTKPDGKGFYELFAIEEFEGSLRFVVKHFHPNWVGWEEKDQALKLRLTRIAPDEAVFGGVAFKREAPDLLVVRLTMRSRDGSTREEVLRFRAGARRAAREDRRHGLARGLLGGRRHGRQDRGHLDAAA